MKVVWLVSGDESSCANLQKEFNRVAGTYVVRHTQKIPQIPTEHLNSSGVAILVDSFHVEHAGFEGLKQLREIGFKGPIYMFGEPAPEKTTTPFTQLELSGFFPSLDRADLSYVTGIVHHCFHLDNHLTFDLLMSTEHKAGAATIKKQEDLESITQKLSFFGSRFGVKEDLIKKTVMGLCMGHIQTKHGESQISEPFELRFGTDRSKIVLSVPCHSKGNDSKVIRSEFAEALANFHNAELKNSVLFQEFHHLVKAVNNLSIIAGSSAVDTEFPDPMFLVTRIQFGTPSETDGHLGYYFSIHHTKVTENLDAEIANLPLLPDPDAVKVAPAQEETTIPSITSHSEKDLSEILNDPVVVGDPPQKKGEHLSLTTSLNETPSPGPTDDKGGNSVKISDDDTIVNKKYLEKTKADLAAMKESNAILSEDVARLMKERKEPALDPELRKQCDDLKAQIAKMESEFEAALKKLNAQIEELKQKDATKKDTKKAA